MSIKAVIFDMDGVLVDSPIHWRKVTQDFFNCYVPDWNESKRAVLTGIDLKEIYRVLIKNWGAKIEEQEFYKFCDEMARKVYQELVSLVPGVKNLLSLISSHSLKIALASSAPARWVKMVLDRFQLEAYFEAVATADDVKRCKPAPDLFLYAAEKINVLPNRCAVIEDSTTGITAAKAAGMYCLALTTTFPKEKLLQADRIISNFTELFSSYPNC